jgi:transcriptional regulator with XRE-family HTH domain
VNRIRQLRMERGLNYSEVARRCNPPTTLSTVRKLEKDELTLTAAWMQRIAAALNCSPADIIGGSEVSVIGHFDPVTGEIEWVDLRRGDPGQIACPPGMDPANTVAICAQDGPFTPILKAFYFNRGAAADVVDPTAVGGLAVSQVRGGRAYLGRLIREEGEIYTIDQMIDRVELDWARRIEWAKP